jgi:hypothetical protein
MSLQPQHYTEPSPVWMSIGSYVTLLPVDLDTGILSGEITHWLGGAAGLVATIGVRTTMDVAATCAGHRLWLSGREAVHNELLVFEVIARKPSRYVDTTLALTGVLPLAHEHRRNAVRAATKHPVRLSFEDGTMADGVAADISRSGCLVALNEADFVHQVGSCADLQIEMPGNEILVLTGDIVRTTMAAGEIALRFRSTELDLAPLDRFVYATVRRERSSEE